MNTYPSSVKATAILAAGICALLPVTSVLNAAPILDQSRDPGTTPVTGYTLGDPENWILAQTFTVGLTGRFDHFDVPLTRDYYATAALGWELRAGLNGTVLASGAILPGSVPTSPTYGWISVDTSGFGLNVTADQTLALVLKVNAAPLNTSEDYGWASFAGTGYPRGATYYRYDPQPWWHDASLNPGFRTYVDVPEPSTIALGALALLPLVARLRKRRTAC